MAEKTYLRVLRHLAGINEKKDGCPTVLEVAEALDLSDGTVRGALKREERLLRVEKAGVAWTNGRTWRITRKGREALAAADIAYGCPDRGIGDHDCVEHGDVWPPVAEVSR